MNAIVNIEEKLLKVYDVIVIGGGQSALACGFYLRRTGLKYLLLDQEKVAGGAWNHGWDSLSLFSPAEYSSLPGFPMVKSDNLFPLKEEVINYLKAYEQKYNLPVARPVKVYSVERIEEVFVLKTSIGKFTAKAIISATGTWSNPYIPEVIGKEKFVNKQMHSAFYKNALEFRNKKVLVVGGGNSGAQILAEISKVSTAIWSTNGTPVYLPDNVDGRVLFDVATEKYNALRNDESYDDLEYNVKSIVMVPSVLDARDRGVLVSKGKVIEIFDKGVVWEDGERELFDVIIWCTGFESSLKHLSFLNDAINQKSIKMDGSRVINEKGVWLVGYGDWTGFASATLAGVGKTARTAVNEIMVFFTN